MSHLYWLREAHLKRIQHLFPKPCLSKSGYAPLQDGATSGEELERMGQRLGDKRLVLLGRENPYGLTKRKYRR